MSLERFDASFLVSIIPKFLAHLAKEVKQHFGLATRMLVLV